MLWLILVMRASETLSVPHPYGNLHDKAKAVPTARAAEDGGNCDAGGGVKKPQGRKRQNLPPRPREISARAAR
jgi:hypothetical protein